MGYIRDIGGYKSEDGRTIRNNCLIRSAQLDKPTASQLEYLKRIGLKKIVDLRNVQETIDEPNVKLDGVKYYNYSLVDSNLNGVTHQDWEEKLKSIKEMPFMIETYKEMVSGDYGLNNIRNALREIVLNDEFPVIVHCVTGKDRAGIVMSLIEYLLDLPYKTIEEDYMKQFPIYIFKAIRLSLLTFVVTFRFDLAKKVYGYYAINKDYLSCVFDTINQKFGSVDAFMYDYVGFTKEDIESFRDRILR